MSALRQYVDAFERFSAALPREEKRLREQQLASFISQGFPSKKIEEWKYTDVSVLAEKSFGVVSNDAPASLNFPSPQPSPPEGGGGVVSLNGAFAQQGLALNVGPGKTVEQEYSTRCEGANMQHQRHRITLGENAKATVILNHSGSGEYFTTQVMLIGLAPGSHLTLYRVQDESAGSYHLAQTDAQLQRDARLDVVTVDLGAGLARHDLNVALTGTGATACVHGLYVPSGKAHIVLLLPDESTDEAVANAIDAKGRELV